MGGQDTPAAAARTGGAALRWAWVLLPRVLGVVIALLAVVWGWNLRMEMFAGTGEVRFRWDVQNALNQGNRVLIDAGLKRTAGEGLPLGEVLAAVVQRYDRVYADAQGSGRYSLDYTPLRLMVMTLWVREVWAGEGQVRTYDDGTMGPLMKLNAVCGLLTALGTFLLMRHWLSRPPPGEGLARRMWNEHRAWVLSLVGSGLVWFNVTLLLNSHVFPQWDVWLLPFYVFACWAGSKRAWGTAGFLIAVGAMLKGQVLLASPVLVVWALCSDWRGVNVLRLAVGAGLGVSAVTWPWLVRDGGVVVWAGVMSVGVLGVAGLVWGLRRYGRLGRLGGMAVPVASGLLLAGVGSYPLWCAGSWGLVAGVGVLGLVACVALWRRPGGALPTVLGGVVALAVLAGGWRYGGSWSWFEVGFRFPTDNYQALAMGTTANLPAILQQHYGWKLKDEVNVGGVGVTLQWLLRGVYFALVVPMGVMAAWYARRGDARVLVCLAVPWVLMFAILPQMHERYLVWGSVLTAMGVGLAGGVMRMGQLGLHVVTTWMGATCIGVLILAQKGGWWPEMERALGPMVPGTGWAVVLLAMVYWFLCMGRPVGGVGVETGEGGAAVRPGV